MKILFAGNHFGIGGPIEVNNNLINALGSRVSYLHYKSKAPRFLELIIKIIISDTIIFSGVSNIDHITVPLSKKLHKTIYFIMHGCLELEDSANNAPNPRGEKNEKILLENADYILCVSPTFKDMMKKRYSAFQNKFGVLTNGVNWNYLIDLIKDSQNIQRDKNRIILFGGGRTTKRNLSVCKAIHELNTEQKLHLYIDLYGHESSSNELTEIKKIPEVHFHHVIPHKEILKEFASSLIFIQNSEFEPFSLGVVEALMCGCDLLISQYVGAKDIIDSLHKEDVIYNPQDINELKDKISILIEHPNNSRLLNGINRNQTGIEVAADRLLEIIYNPQSIQKKN